MAILDDEDYKQLSKRKWYFSGAYAARFENRRVVFLHKEIMKPETGQVVDHINHNKLDNRKSNLRVVTPSENSFNRKGANANNKSTGLRGIYFNKSTGYYQCDLTKNGIRFRTSVNSLLKAKAIIKEWQNEPQSRKHSR